MTIDTTTAPAEGLEAKEPTIALATLDALEALLAAHRRLAELEDDVSDARLQIEECQHGLARAIEEQVAAHMKATRWEV